MKGLLILKGPGLKKGFALKQTVNIADLVPTLCYLAKLPFPQQCEGRVIYQALEDKDQHLTELRELQERYDKLEETIRIQRSLTHSYE